MSYLKEYVNAHPIPLGPAYLAHNTGYSKSYVKQLLANTKPLSDEAADRFSALLHVSPYQLKHVAPSKPWPNISPKRYAKMLAWAGGLGLTLGLILLGVVFYG